MFAIGAAGDGDFVTDDRVGVWTLSGAGGISMTFGLRFRSNSTSSTFSIPCPWT